MRQAFAVEALVDLAPGADSAAVGGAVTLALCGAFEHPGPCPLAPHRTTVDGDAPVRARVVGVRDADQRAVVLEAIDGALRAGAVVDPSGTPQRWTVRSSAETQPRDEERAFTDRLLASAG